jgi:hypothetical protein
MMLFLLLGFRRDLSYGSDVDEILRPWNTLTVEGRERRRGPDSWL